MRHFLVCKKGRGTRRELLGLYIVTDVPGLIAAVGKKMHPAQCLALEPSDAWEIGLVGRINPNQQKAYVDSAFFNEAAIVAASTPDMWRELNEIV